MKTIFEDKVKLSAHNDKVVEAEIDNFRDKDSSCFPSN